MKSRLNMLAWIGLALGFLQASITVAATARPAKRANVLIVLTDDQGYGDFSCHGNPILKTPNLDKLHDQSIRFTDFHVCLMCTPTRSRIMTGRDCLTTGAYVVCSGHDLLREGLPTMADCFAAGMFVDAGYHTGQFGKWHLGGNYPFRPQDRGFQESICFRGFGLVCSSDHWNNDGYNGWYLHNGKPQQYQGYCTDIWFTEAMRWMKSCAARKEPFLVYLPTNAAHGPCWVPKKYSEPYKGKVKPGIADFFGMIANIDENMARLDAMLKDTGLYDNTLLIFMTDNGGTAGVPVWNAGMRGHKTEYYDGGHRVPCFVRWPAGGLRQAGDIADLTQCQDLLPTLVDLCKLHAPKGAHFDGVSLAALLHGKPQPELADRKLVVQYGIMDEYMGPTKWNCAVMWGKWRLFRGKELYNVATDPGQKTDVAALRPEIVKSLREHYETWWARTEPLSREFPPIHLGSDHENPVCLTSQDWVALNTDTQDCVRAGINRNGPWHVLVEREGEYRVALRRWPSEADTAITAGLPMFVGTLDRYPPGKALPIVEARLKVSDVDQSKDVTKEDKAATFTVHLPAGKTTLQTWFYDRSGKPLCGAITCTWKKPRSDPHGSNGYPGAAHADRRRHKSDEALLAAYPYRPEQAGVKHRPAGGVETRGADADEIDVVKNLPRHVAAIEISDTVGRKIRDFQFQPVADRFQVADSNPIRIHDERSQVLPVQAHPHAVADPAQVETKRLLVSRLGGHVERCPIDRRAGESFALGIAALGPRLQLRGLIRFRQGRPTRDELSPPRSGNL